ncbi:MAG: hypothetical protein ACP5JF_05325 [Candidatus Methanodesulfokora sp.]|jgi:DNA-binding transcriptional ArsR family regulator
MFRPIHASILDAIVAHPEGISVNKLAKELKGRVSRSVLLREMRKMREMGLITIGEDERHKQRRIVSPRKEVMDAIKDLEELEIKNLDEAVRLVKNMFHAYAEARKKVKNKLILEYMKHRMKARFSAILEVIK